MERLSLTVNGESVEVEISPDQMLSSVLREGLGLTGTKIACEEAECGSCTVLLQGAPVLSCMLPAWKAQGKAVVTIEGLAKGQVLHPLQEAFIKQGAVQCGFCTPGQIMTAYALLEADPQPSQARIRAALKDTLCRCGAYPAIERAIQAVAESMHTGEPLSPPDLPVTGDQRVVGRYAARPDAEAKVRGEARFADDYAFPGMLHARVLRAGVPHAILGELDARAAEALPGVHAVLTAEDIPGERNHGLVTKDWPVLVGVGEKVRYVGDAIALVAADSREVARQALARIQLRLEQLPVVDSPTQAHAKEAPLVHAGGNLLEEINVRKGDLQRGFAEVEVSIEGLYHTPTMEHVFMEPECSIAWVTEEGRIQILVGSQIPYADREQVAACLGVPEEQVRVVGTLIGGGFGGKEDIAGQIHAALLARATGRPVKLLYNRRESILVHPKRHATQIRVRLGADRAGRLLAADTELYGDTGAYASLGEHVMTRATTHSSGPYVIPHVRAKCFAMYTNNPPAGAFRGFGALQSAFAIESAMDELAEALDMDPIQLRKVNALREGELTNTGQRLRGSVGLLECIEEVEARLGELVPDRDPFQQAPVADRPTARSAWGFAVAFKNTGLGGGAPDKAGAEVELYEDGMVEVRTSSAEIGQGLVTVLQLIAAEELETPLEQVKVLLSDTDLTPDGGPTTASRQTYVSGNAVRNASIALREAMKGLVAEKLDCPPAEIQFSRGSARINGTEIGYGEIAAMMRSEGREPMAAYDYSAPETQPLGTGGDMHFAFSFAAQAAEVEVDLETGEVRVPRVIAATDVGRAINPVGLLGQIEGGVVMGLGHVLTEAFILEKGRVITDRMARYRMPSITHTPEILSVVVEDPSAHGPYGAKGVGEISTMPILPAIANGIYRASGVRLRRLPFDQDWLARQIARPDRSSSAQRA